MRRQIVAEFHALRDATERLDEQTAELERSNTELEQFAYVASHDLQEPLRKVASFCQLLERRYKGQLDERADQYIEFAVDGAKRMQVLINDLLAFSRVGRLTRSTSRSAPTSWSTRRWPTSSLAIEESGATVTVAEDMPPVSGDARCWSALFQNLIGNAHQVPRRRGRREITRRPGPTPATSWEFSVADNGIGIEPEYADRIFVIFQRLHAEGRLPRHRHRAGHVPEDRRVPRRPDLAGHLAWPAAPSSASPCRRSQRRPAARTSRRPLDDRDDGPDRRAARGDRRPARRGRPGRRADDPRGVRGAQAPQHACTSSNDGVEAVAFLRREGEYADAPRPGLILLDLNLPRKDGREVLAEIKADESLRAIPVVVLTTSEAEEDVLRCYDLHANAYVTKPVDFERFIKVVQQIDDFFVTVVKLPQLTGAARAACAGRPVVRPGGLGSWAGCGAWRSAPRGWVRCLGRAGCVADGPTRLASAGAGLDGAVGETVGRCSGAGAVEVAPPLVVGVGRRARRAAGRSRRPRRWPGRASYRRRTPCRPGRTAACRRRPRSR